MKRLFIHNLWYKKYRFPFPFIDIYFFKWKPNIQTKIHNHSSSGCLMILLNGNLQENIYDSSLQLVEKKIYNKFLNISYIYDKIGYHDIQNITSKPSYSLH